MVFKSRYNKSIKIFLSEESPYIYYSLLVLVGGVFLLFAKFGLGYMIGNQTTYLLHGLRLYDPTFIVQDWYVWKTFPYHFSFSYLIYFLQLLGPLSVTTVIAQAITMMVLSWGLLLLSNRFCKYPLHVYLSIITWMGVHTFFEVGLGWQQFISGYLQPSEIAGCFMVLGLALLFERKYIFSGFVLGIGGIFHAAILASFAPIILVTALATPMRKSLKLMISFGLPIICFWGFFTFIIGMELLKSPPVQETMSIIINLRNVGDLLISNWSIIYTTNWIIWVGLGAFAIFTLPAENKYREIRVSFIAVLVCTFAFVAQMAILKIPSITSMMLWRAAPWATILGLVILLDHCIHLFVMHGKVNKIDKLLMIFLIIGSVILAISGWRDSITRTIWIASIPLAAVIGMIAKRFHINWISSSKFIIIILLFIIGLKSIVGINNSYNYHWSQPVLEELQLYEWVRENTPENSMFIIPTSIESMRIRGRRAVVVEWKSTTSIASDLKEWYQRILDVHGFPESTLPTEVTSQLLEKGYLHLDTKRAKLLQERYDADYIVILAEEHRGNLDGLIGRFRNEKYLVLEIPSEGSHSF
jgi:hypothetical protein